MSESSDQMIIAWLNNHGDWLDDNDLDVINQMLDVYVQSPELQELFYFEDFYIRADEECIKIGNIHIVPTYSRASLDSVKSIEEAMVRAQVCNDAKVIAALEQLQKINEMVLKAKTQHELVRKEQEKAV